MSKGIVRELWNFQNRLHRYKESTKKKNPSADENFAPSRSMEAIPYSWGSLITLHGSGYDHARHNYMTIWHG
ncbi:hypothetical protein MTR_6g037760 [Medicago truncatula]|uniref:Uncharacterized protein n=1 Tax=Medicago truncatula TaxID=3880 RepID=A0A072UA24_MEDTR|nr:hypothetical protein MTR_6g037760 [Medicago truncatula]